jgi:signal transduction histidine kinase
MDLPVTALVQNAALLLAVAVVFDAASSRLTIERRWLDELLSGVFLGVIGVTIMLSPWQFASGIFFDTRTVLLVIAGLFFGWVPTVMTVTAMVAFRLSQPGAAALTGIIGMLLAAGLGLAWRRLAGAREELSFRRLLMFGFAAHVIVLGQASLSLFLTLPRAVAGAAVEGLWLPLLTVYPVATALLGVLLVVRLRARRLTATNAALLDEVRASRLRIVQAGDAERRRLERDLHDGAQQRLVALSLALRSARSKTSESDVSLRDSLDRAAADAQAALDELRELALGIHPLILTESGLSEAVESLAARTPVDVSLDIDVGRLPAPVEGAAYFVISEALANVAKYANATRAAVRVQAKPDLITIDVEDDGVGGADARGGSGLRGLADRLAAFDGTISVVSPLGAGTRISAVIPTADRPAVSVPAL